jgi:hypothetical protein
MEPLRLELTWVIAASVGQTVGLVLGLVAAFFVIFGGILISLGYMARQKEAQARQRYPTARKIDRAASFFGQQSRGVMQLRGNGILILTDTELIFELWVPKRMVHIPVETIRSVENPRSFLGKSRFTPLLKVVFVDEHGVEDAIAWQVRDRNDWMRKLADVRN